MDSSPENPRPSGVSQPILREGPRRRTLLLGVGGVLLAGVAIAAAALAGVLPDPFQGPPPPPAANPTAEDVPLVKVVRPKRLDALPIIVDQIAVVEPYYRADLRARASGIVKSVHHDIGERVKKGDTLIVIDVPEFAQDVVRCQALVTQRQKELRVSEAHLKDALAARDVSAATIKQREADVQSATATRDYKRRKLQRYKDLADRGSVVGSVVEEEERDYLASEAMVVSAKANVDKARADYAESSSKIEGAQADIELKTVQIDVAKADLERAKAVANLANVVAPFDGVVVRRAVDPGSFVQNATTGTSESLISISRMDLVTVSAKFPDTTLSAISKDTQALVTFDDIPGVAITGAISRYAPSVFNADRTMRVEVDLFNGDQSEYLALVDAVKQGPEASPLKGGEKVLPHRVFSSGTTNQRYKLIPGMTGTLRLTLGGFGESFVLPKSAVYSRSGVSHVLMVIDGVTHEFPVQVQLSDGKTVRVALRQDRTSAASGSHDLLTELRGDEDIVFARQLEIGPGARVKTGLADW